MESTIIMAKTSTDQFFTANSMGSIRANTSDVKILAEEKPSKKIPVGYTLLVLTTACGLFWGLIGFTFLG
jgi:hypothetical protein